MSEPGSHDATFYIQIQPDFGHYSRDPDRPYVRGIKPVTMTQRKPSQPKGGTIQVKLTLRIPDSAFHPLRPEAVIVIPESMVQPTPMLEVEVHDPRDEEGPDEASPPSPLA